MPIPRPRPRERRQAFMDRCIPTLIETEGEEANVAGGICASQWEGRNKETEMTEEDLIRDLQALAIELEEAGMLTTDPSLRTLGSESMSSASLGDLEAELRAVEIPEHMRNPRLMGTEDDLLQEP